MGAIISDDGLYRYWLHRHFGNDKTAIFIMLNPSTADAEKDDPTIRRCISFAKRERCGQLEVVNLYALRATKPTDLWAHNAPVGPMNNEHIRECLNRNRGAVVIAAWGAHAKPGRTNEVMQIMASHGVNLMCLGTTKDGHPRHPLYVKSDQPLVPLP